MTLWYARGNIVAHSCPKHVEKSNKHIEKICENLCTDLVLFTTGIIVAVIVMKWIKSIKNKEHQDEE